MKYKLLGLQIKVKQGKYKGDSEKEIAEKIGKDISKLISQNKLKINFIMVEDIKDPQFEDLRMYEIGKKTNACLA